MAKVGDRIPDVEVRVMTPEGRPETVRTSRLPGHRAVRARPRSGVAATRRCDGPDVLSQPWD